MIGRAKIDTRPRVDVGDTEVLGEVIADAVAAHGAPNTFAAGELARRRLTATRVGRLMLHYLQEVRAVYASCGGPGVLTYVNRRVVVSTQEGSSWATSIDRGSP